MKAVGCCPAQPEVVSGWEAVEQWHHLCVTACLTAVGEDFQVTSHHKKGYPCLLAGAAATPR